MALLNSPAYESAAYHLRDAAPRQYNFSKASLSDCMRLMAEDAGIGFFGLPDGTNGGDRLVTFTLSASPFMALETLAKANGVSLIYDSGIWYLRPANDQELIGRIYEINYNAQELVTKNSQGGGVSGGGGSGGGFGGGSSLNLQGSPDFFVTEPSRILEDIQNILDIPTTGGNANFAPTASVDNVAQFSLGAPQDIVHRPNASGGGRSNEEGGQSKVIWNSDSNSLYVVAPRQQHQWIEAYLASADRPQPMISVEVKFLETRKNPKTDFGIDWDGALGDNGLEVTLSDNSGPFDLNSLGGYQLPTAVLSYSDLSWKLRALYQDQDARAVSFPRMVTLDNREVSFRSVVNQPVLGSSASASLGAGATQTSSIEYLPIGTVINILPKRMSGDNILLNVSVTISDIIGTEVINGNPFPIATSRVYTAPLTVKSGYTVAISGLDAAKTGESEKGVPILGRLPLIGYAFKNRREERNRQHLMMLITPVALDPGTEGLTKKPITCEPWKKPPVGYGSGKAPIYDSPQNYPVEEVPAFNSANVDKKSNQTFGQKDSVQLVATPTPAVVTERSPGGDASTVQPVQSSVPEAKSVDDLFGGVTKESSTDNGNNFQPIPSALNTPMVVESIGRPEEAPQSEMKEEPEVKSGGIAKAETELPTPSKPEKSGETDNVAELREGLEALKTELAEVPKGDSRLSPDDGQLVVNIYEEAQVLLENVDTVRGGDSRPLQGDLGDVWWELINVKTQALKMSRRSTQNLALQSEEDEVEP
tara:strand:- start:3164 stop:5449 length:2286 start_codon:yes stop_codon:yes gene_type:complete